MFFFVETSFYYQVGGKEATTYGSNFMGPAQTEPVIMGQVGPKENSGFVTNAEIEPLTRTLGERWHYRSRPTGTSEYDDRYQQYDYPKVKSRHYHGVE